MLVVGSEGRGRRGRGGGGGGAVGGKSMPNTIKIGGWGAGGKGVWV